MASKTHFACGEFFNFIVKVFVPTILLLTTYFSLSFTLNIIYFNIFFLTLLLYYYVFFVNKKVKEVLDIYFLELNQKSYFKQILYELTKTPETGLYKNSPRRHFINFIKYYKFIFENFGGERNIINEKIVYLMRKKENDMILKNESPTINTELTRIRSKIGDKIHVIKHRFEQYSNGSFDDYLKLQERIDKLNYDVNCLKDNTSQLYLRIASGLRNPPKKKKKSRKGRSEKEINEFVNGLIEKKESFISKYEVDLTKLAKYMEKEEQYQNWKRLKGMLQPYFDMWDKVDKKIGKESNQRGESFEGSFCNVGVKLIIRNRLKRKLSDCVIFKNKKWDCKDSGEVDIIVATKSHPMEFLCLIECKARAFDIAEGHRQSSTKWRQMKGKEFVKNLTCKGNTRIPFDIPCYVLTLVPPNPFNLKMESLLKDKLNKVVNKIDHTYTYEEMYDLLKPWFENLVTPLQWYEKYAKEFLVVMK